MKTLAYALLCCLYATHAFSQTNGESSKALVELQAGETSMSIALDGFRYRFSHGGKEVASAHPTSGIVVDGSPLNTIVPAQCSATHCGFSAKTANGGAVVIDVSLASGHCVLKVTPARKVESVLLRTAGMSPSYGLGDRAAADRRDNTDLTGLVDDHLLSGRQFVRLVSNFIIFPKQGMSEILISPDVKILHLTAEENAQGLEGAEGAVTMHYFFGTPPEMYKLYAETRREAGAPLMMPKYEMFGVGWEAFGALAWNTNQQTVQESVDHYLALGYPLKWMVIGSGFWPAKPDDMHETTSFGQFDRVRYPTPKEFFQHFHNEGLKVLLGLRITFITTGPFAEEGVKKDYFIEENGSPKAFKAGWPIQPCYLLNAQSPEAVSWYLNLVSKWKAYGIDGFKEDFYGFGKYPLRDDKLDPVNRELMLQGYDLIERNGYLTSDGDIDRIDDFNYNQDQDRGPVNALSLAYSGLPLVYPDIVGGTFGEGHFDTKETAAMATYMMRNAQWASLHSSMSVGQPPWSFHDPRVGDVMLKAAQAHERLHPYLYNQAVRFIHDGFPWTMTPLPIAYPTEAGAYGRENRAERGYEWMIGDALLAAPLYGDDYATAQSRDIYLPRGKWIEYETGKVFNGPTLLKNHELPVERTPLFAGGTGIVFEQGATGIVARIYPIDKTAHTEFWASDAISKSSVTLSVKSWSSLKVVDSTTNKRVPYKTVRFATEFPLVPGHSYRVE